MKLRAAALSLAVLLSCSSPSLGYVKTVAAAPVAEDSQPEVVAEEPATFSPNPAAPMPPMFEVTSFDERYIAPLIATVQAYDRQGVPEIIIRINTNGGSVAGDMELIQALEALHAKRICVVEWHAYSAGAFLLESDACTLRLMTKRSTILLHEPLVGETGGNKHALRDVADQLDALGKALVAQTAERMHMTEAQLTAKIDNKVWTMAYREAFEANAVDGIISPRDLPPLIVVKPLGLLQMLLGG